MKARVKATGTIIDVYNWGDPTFRGDDGNIYQRSELDFDIEDENNPDYWERLKHQYAGMAMQGILACEEWKISPREGVSFAGEVALQAHELATALVEKLKNSDV